MFMKGGKLFVYLAAQYHNFSPWTSLIFYNTLYVYIYVQDTYLQVSVPLYDAGIS